eukprot:Seg1833.9 transcript_id=Seg1833.9/GoldUCD/mRNA.D3Y31 product="Choline transporter-like protein 4" protein_id=Seg1833.9/GoldUCD/D3Y31
MTDETDKGTVTESESEKSALKGEESLESFGDKRKYDPNFKGPIQNRGCTDIPCCVLFGVYMIGMIVIGIIALKTKFKGRNTATRQKTTANTINLIFANISSCHAGLLQGCNGHTLQP